MQRRIENAVASSSSNTDYHRSPKFLRNIDNTSMFPETLEYIKEPLPLSGGTASTFKVKDTNTQREYVLKLGANEAQIKIEMLMNVLYKRLGVPVPCIQAYRTIPIELAQLLKLSQTEVPVQLAEWLAPEPHQEEQSVIDQACQDFVVHAFIGNIDVARFSNYIQTKLIDSGANFLFRALGDRREENIFEVSELDSMRNAEINPEAAQWFKNIDHKIIKEQVKKLVNKRDIIEKTIWELSQELELPPLLQQQLLTGFSNRLDYLVQRYDIAADTLMSYRPLTSPQKVKTEIITTQLKKAKVLNDIRHKMHRFFTPSIPLIQMSHPHLSQSELHLRMVMGADFHSEAPIEANVSVFIEKYSQHQYTAKDKEKLITQAVQMIRREKDEPDRVFFYHGTNNKIAYAYTVYKAIYQILAANQSCDAMRMDHALFHVCLDIQQFMIHFQNHSSKDRKISNYDAGYMECALSTNLFLFGCHQLENSCTINFYTENKTYSQVNMTDMFLASFQGMGVGNDLLTQLNDLMNLFPQRDHGFLYQISLPQSEADRYAYISAVNGRLNPLTTEHGQTTNVTQLLQALNTTLVQKEYVERVQARLMTPPDAPIVRHEYYWGEPVCEEVQTTFNQQIAKLAHDIAFDILQNYNELMKLNSHTALSRYLPKIYQQAGLNEGVEQITDELVLCHIATRDFKRIKTIIETQPEYKEKLIYSKKISYKGSKSSIKENKTILERLVELRVSTEILHEIYGTPFYEEKLNTLPFYLILSTIPLIDRLSFAMTHQHRINNAKNLTLVLKELKEQDRMEFAIAQQSKILDEGDLYHVLKTLPEEHRFDFANAHQDMLEDGEVLALVIYILPSCKKLEFANLHCHKIQKGKDLSLVIEKLSYEDKLIFAIKHQDKIRNGKGLAYVVEKLPTPQNLNFAINQQSKIRNGTELALVIAALPENCKQEFIPIFFDKINDGYMLSEVLKILPKDKQLEFATTHMTKIQDGDELLNVLNTLFEDHRIGFAIQCEDKIHDGYDLSHILTFFPEDNRVAFATTHVAKIQNGDELFHVVYTFLKKHQLAFIMKYEDIIQDGYDLTRFIVYFSEDKKLEFATRHQNKIQNYSQLSSILRVLPTESRLEFATRHLDKIQKSDDFSSIVETLPEENRLEFAMEHQDKIQDGYDLSHLLPHIPKDNRLEFAIKHRDKIHDIDDFLSVLSSLSKSTRLEFAQLQLDKVEDSKTFSRVLKRLSEEDKLPLTRKYETRTTESSLRLATL